MEPKNFTPNSSRDLISVNLILSKKENFEPETSIKKIGTKEYNQRKSTFKFITSTRFPEKSLSNLDFIKEKKSSHKNTDSNEDEKSFHLLKNDHHKHKPKGVHFRDRISIENRESMDVRKQKFLIDISNE